MATVEIPYKPRNWAKTLHDSVKRWIVMVLHRRAGKTTAVLNHLQRDALRIPKSQFAYIGPTFKQAKRIAWEIAKEISSDIPGIEWNESELTVKYPNKSKLFLAGSDNIDSLRGIPLWGAAGDEWPLQNPALFTQVISKCLADHLGYFLYLGTPKGKDHFHKTYKNALKHPDDYTVIFKTIDNSLKEESGETIENLRQALEDDKKLVAQGEMTEDEFNQEWYCSFEAAIKGAIYSKQIADARKKSRVKSVPYDREIPVHTVWDLGVGQALAIGFYQRIGRELHMIDFWEGEGFEGIADGILVVQNRGYIYGKHFAPHDVRAKEESTGKTRLQFAAELALDFEVVPQLSVDDGIDKGKLMFGRLWIDEVKCEDWLDTISAYRTEYDDNKQMMKEVPLHDWTSHAADVHRYAAVIEDEMTNVFASISNRDIDQTRRERAEQADETGA